MLLAAPVRGVVFDLHQTLVDGGDAAAWLDAGWAAAGRPGTAVEGLGPAEHERVVALLDRIWEHADEIDPDFGRDLSVEVHRQVTLDTLTGNGVDDDLAVGIHGAMLDRWHAYEDAVPVLTALREKGVRTALLTNLGFDPRPLLAESGLLELLDELVVSFEAQAVKPTAKAFQAALDALGTSAEETLMVGDSVKADAAAASLGIRTLLLPRTQGPVHGLELVLRLVG